MDKLNALMSNTTSLVGYIAVLMIAGAYLGGTPNLVDGSTLQSSVINAGATRQVSFSNSRQVIITLDGHSYVAEIQSELPSTALSSDFTY